jgi:hypothetical protein
MTDRHDAVVPEQQTGTRFDALRPGFAFASRPHRFRFSQAFRRRRHPTEASNWAPGGRSPPMTPSPPRPSSGSTSRHWGATSSSSAWGYQALRRRSWFRGRACERAAGRRGSAVPTTRGGYRATQDPGIRPSAEGPTLGWRRGFPVTRLNNACGQELGCVPRGCGSVGCSPWGSSSLPALGRPGTWRRPRQGRHFPRVLLQPVRALKEVHRRRPSGALRPRPLQARPLRRPSRACPQRSSRARPPVRRPALVPSTPTVSPR